MALGANILYNPETAQGPNINYFNVFNEAEYNCGNL